MGRDKALLPHRGTTLVEHVLSAVRQAAGRASLIGDPARYHQLGYAIYPDIVPSRGPIGGLYTALKVSSTDWNLVLACDMPGISAPVLRDLLNRAERSSAQCVAAAGPEGMIEPLCAVYHRDCLPVVERAVNGGQLKMRDLLPRLSVESLGIDAGALANANTPDEWIEFERRTI
jgi:molybdopterin-guanine dinucleotide biosynthesis protein A